MIRLVLVLPVLAFVHCQGPVPAPGPVAVPAPGPELEELPECTEACPTDPLDYTGWIAFRQWHLNDEARLTIQEFIEFKERAFGPIVIEKPGFQEYIGLLSEINENSATLYNLVDDRREAIAIQLEAKLIDRLAANGEFTEEDVGEMIFLYSDCMSSEGSWWGGEILELEEDSDITPEELLTSIAENFLPENMDMLKELGGAVLEKGTRILVWAKTETQEQLGDIQELMYEFVRSEGIDNPEEVKMSEFGMVEFDLWCTQPGEMEMEPDA